MVKEPEGGVRSIGEAVAALSHHDVWHLRSLPRLCLPALSIQHGKELHASSPNASERFSTDCLSIGSPNSSNPGSGFIPRF